MKVSDERLGELRKCWHGGVASPDFVIALEERLAAAEAVIAKLPIHIGGELFSEYDTAPGAKAWCCFRYDWDEPWRVSQCKKPEDPEEASTGFDWLVEDAEDECIFHGPFISREASEAAQEAKA